MKLKDTLEPTLESRDTYRSVHNLKLQCASVVTRLGNLLDYSC